MRPEDPEKAQRWETPLYWHISALRDSMHALRNHTQSLSGLIEQFGRKLDRNAQISLENRDAIARLTEISRKIEASAAQIERAAGVVVREKPLLMRNLYWLDTNPVEIGLILYTAGEAMIFLIESEALLRSAMFRAMSMICGSPGLWGIGCGLLSLGAAIAFASRAGGCGSPRYLRCPCISASPGPSRCFSPAVFSAGCRTFSPFSAPPGC